jgi:hypothetical protein
MSEGLRAQNWSAKAGESIRLPIPVFDADGGPTNLAGAVARFALSRTEQSAPVVASYAPMSNAVATIPSPTDGQVLVTIASAITQALIGPYYWECEVEDVFQNQVTVAFGRAVFEPNLIR